MRVILQKDVKDLGKVGDVVNVKQGFARNFLFPRNLAQQATENNEKEWVHLKKVAEVRMKKATKDRQGTIDAVQGVTVVFKRSATDTDKLFGSIAAIEISQELEKHNLSVDKKDIHLEEPIKMLGQHKAVVKLGDGLEAELSVTVERED